MILQVIEEAPQARPVQLRKPSFIIIHRGVDTGNTFSLFRIANCMRQFIVQSTKRPACQAKIQRVSCDKEDCYLNVTLLYFIQIIAWSSIFSRY